MSKFQENLKIDCNLAPSLPSRNEKIEIVPKIEYNHLLNFPWKFYITQFRKLALGYFVKDCLRKQNWLLYLVQTPWDLNFLQILVFQKPFTLLKLIFKATEMWQIATFDNFQE